MNTYVKFMRTTQSPNYKTITNTSTIRQSSYNATKVMI